EMSAGPSRRWPGPRYDPGYAPPLPSCTRFRETAAGSSGRWSPRALVSRTCRSPPQATTGNSAVSAPLAPAHAMSLRILFPLPSIARYGPLLLAPLLVILQLAEPAGEAPFPASCNEDRKG